MARMGTQIGSDQPRAAAKPSTLERGEFDFGDFRLFPAKRLLLEGGRPVPVGSQALDLLILLLERAGELASKEELMRSVWPETHVAEGNLTVHVAPLRRILKDGRNGRRFIINIPGRGYRFVEPVRTTPTAGAFTCAVPRHKVPSRLTRLVGRDAIIREFSEHLPQQRLATITGPPGVGKCSVAHAVAEVLVSKFRDGVWQVDLVTITKAEQVPRAVAVALAPNTGLTNPSDNLVEMLQGKAALAGHAGVEGVETRLSVGYASRKNETVRNRRRH
jgi:DNA-binding winged helix-turn-helix (wHTH) protein